MKFTPICVSVKAIYAACCNVSNKAKELAQSKPSNSMTSAEELFEYSANQFTDVKAVFDNKENLRIESSDALFDGSVSSGETFVEAQKTAASALCEKLGICKATEAMQIIASYLDAKRD